MKIMYCVNDISNSGGVEKILSLKINYLVKEYNYEVVILSWNIKNDLFFQFDNRVKIINLDVKYQNNYLKRQLIKLKKYLELKKILKNNKIDILISTGFPIDILFPKLKKFSKIIYEFHISKYSLYLNIKFLKKLYRCFYDKLILKKYDKVIILTNEELNYWNLSNIKVIPNVLSFNSKIVSNCKNKKIISIGRLTEQKGFDILIDVWKKVNKKHSNWILEIYGEGSLRKELQDKIDSLNLTDTLILKGNEKNIQSKYLESSIYVMSSRYEGFGMVLIEAMSCGLPLVSFDCPCGPKDIIKDGENGFLVKFGNIDKMAEKINYLIENEDKRIEMGEKSKELSYNYSKDKIMIYWKELFESLLEGKNDKQNNF